MAARLSRIVLPPLVVLAALVAYRLVAVGPQQPGVVLPRNEPLTIGPRFDDPRVVTDEQLAAVLARVTPPTDPINTNNFVHALRLWGTEARFDQANGKAPSGQELRDYFLDDATFRRFAGEKTPPLFTRRAGGIDVRSFDDQVTDRETSSYHADDLVATLAEVGTPLDAPLRMRGGEGRVRDLLVSSLRRFHLDQLEYEWTAIAYARYVFPQEGWRNQYGDRIDADKLVEEILSHPLEMGPCNGLHRLEALAVLYRADEQAQALRPRTRQRIVQHMRLVSRLLTESQSPDGSWNRQWPRGAAAVVAKEKSSSLHDQLLVTGHHLEWLALVPEEVQPPRESIVRAGQWLARTLAEMDAKTLLDAYGPYTHAARALCLWRSAEPYEVWSKAHAAAAGG